MQRVLIGAGLLVAATVAASAQTAAPDGPPKPLLENAQIKVIEMRWRPGARTEAVNRPNSFVYALTDGTLVFVPPGRTPYEMSFRAGEALWLPSQTTALVNEGGKEIRALVVELKEKAPAAAAKPKRKAASASAGKPAAKKGKPKP
jgi:hypothetical protein